MGETPDKHDFVPEVLKQAPEKSSSAQLFLRSLSVVLLVIAVPLLFFLFFKGLMFEDHSRDELFSKLNDSRSEIRRLAASQWLQDLNRYSKEDAKAYQKLLPTDVQVETLLKQFDYEQADAQYFSSVISILGFVESSARQRVIDGLTQFLEKTTDDVQTQAQIFALISLSRLGAEADKAWALFEKKSQSADASLRNAVALSVGQYSLNYSLLAEKINQILGALMADENQEVRWNAVTAMARRGSERAVEPMLFLLRDLQSKEHNLEALPVQKLRVFEELIKASRGLISKKEIHEIVSSIAAQHQNLRLRQLAKEVLLKKS